MCHLLHVYKTTKDGFITPGLSKTWHPANVGMLRKWGECSLSVFSDCSLSVLWVCSLSVFSECSLTVFSEDSFLCSQSIFLFCSVVRWRWRSCRSDLERVLWHSLLTLLTLYLKRPWFCQKHPWVCDWVLFVFCFLGSKICDTVYHT